MKWSILLSLVIKWHIKQLKFRIGFKDEVQLTIKDNFSSFEYHVFSVLFVRSYLPSTGSGVDRDNKHQFQIC